MSVRTIIRGMIRSDYFFVITGLIGLSVISALSSGSFLTLDNMVTILRQTSILAILSFGLTMVVITGHIDLSVGSFSALCGCICAQLLVQGRGVAIAVSAGLLTGLLVGLINGFLVGWLKLPSFVATYGMNMVAAGLATIVMNGGVIYGLPPGLTRLGAGELAGVPIPIIFALLSGIGFYFLLERTTFGRRIYLIGLNSQAAEYSAINTKWIILITYALCGLSGALGGIITTARLNAADAGMTETYGLRIIAAVVVGGTSLLGGQGGIPGTVLGALILTMITNIMNIRGVQAEWQNLVVGVIILLMAGLDYIMKNRVSGRLGDTSD